MLVLRPPQKKGRVQEHKGVDWLGQVWQRQAMIGLTHFHDPILGVQKCLRRNRAHQQQAIRLGNLDVAAHKGQAYGRFSSGGVAVSGGAPGNNVRDGDICASV